MTELERNALKEYMRVVTWSDSPIAEIIAAVILLDDAKQCDWEALEGYMSGVETASGDIRGAIQKWLTYNETDDGHEAAEISNLQVL